MRRYSRKIKKGGFFFNKNSYVVPSEKCDPNKLTTIKGSQALHSNYQLCCPKGSFGTKNTSPYCKQVDLNFQAALKEENEAKGYVGFEPDEVYQMKQQDDITPKKPWYKFWGGKTKKMRKSRKLRKVKKCSYKKK